jgi:hypothetical protein
MFVFKHLILGTPGKKSVLRIIEMWIIYAGQNQTADL